MQEPERRDTYRCRISSDDESAVLRTRNKDLLVRICEKSSGGFGVVSPGLVKLRQGAILSLATDGGCCEVEVVHVQQCDNRLTRIGLKTRRELQFLHSPLFSLFTVRRMCAGGATLLKLATILLLCAGFFVWGATLPLVELAGAANRLLHRTQPAHSPAVAPRPRERQLGREYQRLNQLTDQRIVIALNLSRHQQAGIQGVLDETAAALAVIRERKLAASPPEQSAGNGMQTIYLAWRRIEQVLTAEQRRRLEALLREADQPGERHER